MAARVSDFEKMAVWSVAAAVVGGALSILAAVAVLQNFHLEHFETIFKVGSMRYYAVLGALGLANLAGVAGFYMGFAGAGHKRNKKSNLSWLGFFANAGVVTLAMCVLVFFWFTKEMIP